MALMILALLAIFVWNMRWLFIPMSKKELDAKYGPSGVHNDKA